MAFCVVCSPADAADFVELTPGFARRFVYDELRDWPRVAHAAVAICEIVLHVRKLRRELTRLEQIILASVRNDPDALFSCAMPRRPLRGQATEKTARFVHLDHFVCHVEPPLPFYYLPCARL